MSDSSYAEEVIRDLYEEADRDWLSFDWILGYVTYDRDDRKFNKTDEQCFVDACAVVRHLFDSGDFSVGQLVAGDKVNTVKYVAFAQGYPYFFNQIRQRVEVDGLANPDYGHAYWLQKERRGSVPRALPREIVQIFDGVPLQ
jgi:hypothetical protein